MSSAEFPTIPDSPVAPSWRARLWRPNRWRLWVQFALLGAFILIIPILLTSRLLLESGRRVLLEHETIDLSDESNLRVNEIQSDFGYFARDVRIEATQRETLPPGTAVFGVLDGVGLPKDALGDQPSTVREARRRFLHGCAVGVYAFDVGPAGEVTIRAQTSPESNPARQKVLLDCLGDMARRQNGVDDRGRPSPYDRSGFWLQPASGSTPARCIVCSGVEVRKAEQRGQFIAFVVDFTQYVRNRQRSSPRHFYFVVNPKGELMVHPYGDDASREADATKALPWKYPEENWFNTAASKKEKQERLGKAVRNGGARLEATAIPGLDYLYRKGSFGDGLSLKKSLPNADPQAVSREFNILMAKELANDGALRIGELSPDFGYVEVSHPDRAKLEAVCKRIDEWYKQQGQKDPVQWSRPIRCANLQGQLTPLRIDQNDNDDPSWLIVAASPEELQEDIDDQFSRIGRSWVYPTLLVSCILGITLVVTLTRSLRRLVASARELSRGVDVPIPLGGPYEVSQLAHTLADVTSRVRFRDRELRDRAARYETILRVAGEGVVITNAAGVIEEANRAAVKMFGYSSDEMIGKPVTLLIKNPSTIPSANEVATSTMTIMSHGGVDTIQGLRKNGSTFWLEMNLKPVQLKDRTVVTCIFRDVSLRREAEERVRKLNDDLESRVRIRTAELEEANTKLDGALKQAEAASRAKDAFVANMSHELRQPLHIIIGFTEALKEDAADLGADNIQPDLNKILSAAKHLLELINDILDLAKISSGKMELALAPFELAPLLADVKTLVGPLAEKNANAFIVVPPAGIGPMIADERRVRQILINLLSNAFKFTQRGVVTLGVRSFVDDGIEWVQFSVKDTGKGMTAEQVQRLFQRFYQADSSTTREQGGTGLGLSITLSFSDLMGGKPIQVNSAPGQGSEFLVTLPRNVGTKPQSKPNRPAAAELAPILEGPAHAGGRTVLVIDDDPMVRELMERFLAKDGFRVVQATNGDEGLRLARTEHPSVITLDVMMPGSDGWSVLAHLKSNPATAEIPVVMLTIVDDRQRGFALGAADYLTKPIDWQRLGAILRKFLAPGIGDTVLIVEDNTESREIVRKYLEREGWKTVEASDGEQGLKAFAETRPALILLDLMMPVLDGFGFLDELGKRFPSHRVPVVVLTAKELTSADFARLNGRVARILEKGDLTHLDKLMELIRTHARK